MTEFFDFLISHITNIYSVLNGFDFDVYGVSVSLADIIVGFIILNMVTLLFWKGAKG